MTTSTRDGKKNKNIYLYGFRMNHTTRTTWPHEKQPEIIEIEMSLSDHAEFPMTESEDSNSVGCRF